MTLTNTGMSGGTSAMNRKQTTRLKSVTTPAPATAAMARTGYRRFKSLVAFAMFSPPAYRSIVYAEAMNLSIDSVKRRTPPLAPQAPRIISYYFSANSAQRLRDQLLGFLHQTSEV